jgi:sulfatase-like protein
VQVGASSVRPIHLAALWSLVVAQPVYDVLRQNGEFFVAHRVSGVDVLLFVAVVSLVIPVLAMLVVRGVSLVSYTAGRIVHLALVGALAGALASQLLARLVGLELTPHLIVTVAGGAAAAWMYARAAPVRLATSLLAVVVPVSAGAFLLHPDMTPFVRPTDPTRDAAVAVPSDSPPIVMVVFDQLPVTSLMRPDGALDRARYPGFAMLADHATWFRNATSNGDLTGWAVPALLSGNLPRRARLPIAAHYPQNVFTVLGGSYRMQVTEPITQLCPERLCGAGGEPRAQRLMGTVLDAAVVYLHVVTPQVVRDRLPPLTNDWRDFLKAQHWQQRWISQRDADRRAPVERFLRSIRRSDANPTLYYLHVLLPHEPYLYTRTGQQITREPGLPGLTRRGRWIGDEWPVLQAYQRHLLQVEYTDAIVERLVRRLTDENLFDRALVVITADHGASFRPGRPFKGLDRHTLPDIVAVPLFVKAPGQRAGRIDDRNVQAIDLLPTLAATLRVQLRQRVDGTAVSDDVPRPARKVIRHAGGTRQMEVDISALERARIEAVARRWGLFDGSRSPVPAGMPRVLIGRPVPADAAGPARSSVKVLLREPELLRQVDLTAPMLPLGLEGRVVNGAGEPAAATLAVAVNGTIRALTRTLDTLAPGTWSAQLEPGTLRAGHNDVQVFLASNGGAQLELAYPPGLRPPALNLASESAGRFWSIRQTGLSPHQAARVPFRWTGPVASIIAPLEASQRPRSLRIGVAGPPASGGIKVEVNGCALYEGPIDSSPWYRTFSLDGCRGLDTVADARIVVRMTGRQREQHGVALETLNLFPGTWPPPTPGPGDLRAAVHVVGGLSPRTARGDPLILDVHNRGSVAWVDATGPDGRRAAAALELRWRRVRGGSDDRSQLLQLPYVLHPADTVRIEVPLVPPSSVDGAGPWELSIVPVTSGRIEIPLDEACTVGVRSRGTGVASERTGRERPVEANETGDPAS